MRRNGVISMLCGYSASRDGVMVSECLQKVYEIVGRNPRSSQPALQSPREEVIRREMSPIIESMSSGFIWQVGPWELDHCGREDKEVAGIEIGTLQTAACVLLPRRLRFELKAPSVRSDSMSSGLT
jgi:hypothetical protein